MIDKRITEIIEIREVDGVAFHHTALPGVVLVEPRIFGDERGFFLETHHQGRYAEGGIDVTFVQDNHSKSKHGTLRGLHAQAEQPQGKLLRAVEGDIFDVAVDARLDSPTFGYWYGTMLTADNFRQLYIPEGFLHGFCVASEVAQVEYKCTEVYHQESEISVRWDDPTIGIEWPVEDPLLSQRDREAQTLAKSHDRLAKLPPWIG